jgi:hypothetical protein
MKKWKQFLREVGELPENQPLQPAQPQPVQQPEEEEQPQQPSVWNCWLLVNGREMFQGDGKNPQEACQHGIEAVNENPELVEGFIIIPEGKEWWGRSQIS